MEHIRVFLKCVIFVSLSYLIISYPVKEVPATARPVQKDHILSLFKKAEASKDVVTDVKKEEPKVEVKPEPVAVVEAPVAPPTPELVSAPAPAPPAPPAPVISGSKQDWMRLAGIPANDWPAVDFIIMHEGHWCPTIWNGETNCPAYHGVNAYKAYGICQALPGTKMAVSGADWETNIVTQLKWCDKYAKERYGGWWSAMAAWQRQGWW